MIALLVVNDHWLKGSGLAPGWLTGKLSDIAGLVVAPLVAAWLLGARSRRTQLAAFALVAICFASVKLWSGAAHALLAILSAVGVRWQLVVDATDLLALSALPLAWWALQRAQRAPRGAPVVAAVAAAACLASGEPEDGGPATWKTQAYLVNGTGQAIELGLRYYEGQLDCAEIGASVERALDPSAFGEGIRFRLEPNETLPVGRQEVLKAAGLSASDMPTEELELNCKLALLQADGLPDRLLWWHDSAIPPASVPINTDDEFFTESEDALMPGRVDLVRVESGAMEAHARGAVRVLPPLKTLEPSSCVAGALRFQWSLPPSGIVENVIHIVRSVRTLADGCLDIELGDGERHDEPYNPPRMLLCIPEGAFPFEPGDPIAVSETFHDGGFWLAISAPADNRRLSVFAGTQADQLPGFHGQLMPLSCAGDRTVCGAYARPAELQIVGKSPALVPGEERTLQIETKSVRVYLGRAEQVIAAPATGCETDRAAVGIRADVVVVEGEVEP